MAGQPKAPFYIVLSLVVLGLVAFAFRGQLAQVLGVKPPMPKEKENERIDPTKLGQPNPATGGAEATAEAHDPAGPTTVKEYTFKPSSRLPEVKGIAGYQPLADKTVKFALNVWAGWGPIILANDGFKPGHLWKTPSGEEFKVELVLIDDPKVMFDTYATGNIHVGWATLDMVPLFLGRMVDNAGKPKDSRAMPRIYQQVDWSNGGDGIVVRESIKTVSDLRGKTIALAENSPSHYFALNMLVAGGVQPAEVKMQFTDTAFQAAAAFSAEKTIAGAVSWAPDIYNLADVKGNRLLVTTGTANKLIADVWFARADFAKDHPEIVEALVRGIFDAMEALKTDAAKQKCAELMAAGYGIPASDCIKMFGDAHSTNWAENHQFFMNQNNPANFERVWNQSYYLYRRIGSITHQPVPFDQVMDYSIIAKLQGEDKYKSQKDEYRVALAPKPTNVIRAESDEILTNTVVIHFYPNSWELHKMVTKDVDGKTLEELYDPSVDLTLKEIARLVGQFGAARVIIEGHTDSSMREQGVPASLVKELSRNRANAVKEALVNKFDLDPNQLNAEGMGWDRPFDPSDPANHQKNRRVEVKVYSAERQ